MCLQGFCKARDASQTQLAVIQQRSCPAGEHDPYWDSEEAPAPGIIGTGDSGEVRHYKRQRRTNWTGLVTMFIYVVILGFYVYVSTCC